MYLNPGDSIAQMTGSSKKESKPAQAKVAEAAGNTSNGSDFEFSEDMTNNPSKNNVSSEDDLDAFLNDLDI
jgi:hypothetical protein